jgi:hypothetical protein
MMAVAAVFYRRGLAFRVRGLCPLSGADVTGQSHIAEVSDVHRPVGSRPTTGEHLKHLEPDIHEVLL